MTTRYRVAFTLAFKVTTGDSVDFEAVLDSFYTELLNIEDREADIVDPDITAHLADLDVDVEMLIDANALLDAQVRAICAIRTALHTLEIGTPGWEAVIERIIDAQVATDELQVA